MRALLADRLLVNIMGWGPDEIREQRAMLQALANFKYDEYQQFSPGTRFIESMVKWLDQFETLNERKIAYDFIRSHLIFFSNDQIGHLVNITFSDKINPILIRKAAKELDIESYLIKKIIDSAEYARHLRRSLFIGLSDGSRIDQLRRSSGINNEQILSTYSIDKFKVDDMLNELEKEKLDRSFNTIFLVDDFTASGTSYFRAEKSKGKIFKFLKAILNINLKSNEEPTPVSNLINKDYPIDLHVIFYVATEISIKKLSNSIEAWKIENNYTFECTIDAIQIIGNDVKERVLKQSDFLKIAEKYHDDSINNRHFKEAENNLKRHLGFNECSLPLVLNHNTPNNSLPLLWFPETSDDKPKGLFPRVNRHRE